MRKAGVAVLFFLLLISISIVSAANETTGVDSVYSCLSSKVKNKCSSLSIEEKAFALLALSYDSSIKSECSSSLKSASSKSECWPSSSCKVKDTAISLIALNYIGEDTKKPEDWLLSKKRVASDLIWYLEIDSTSSAKCKINYDSKDYEVTLDEAKKFSGSAGSCFELSLNNYFLKIKDTCVAKNFSVSCDKDFVSSLFFKTTSSDTLYLSELAESASTNGKTNHVVKSSCFGLTSCEYESSLWATLALKRADKDIQEYLPYLISFAEKDNKLFPYPILYLLTGSEEYLNEILLSQKTDGYWNINNKYYDSALALMALPSNSANSQDSAKTYFLESKGSDGCFSGTRDTAFLLFAGWPKQPSSSGTTELSCSSSGYYCTGSSQCTDSGGKELKDYSCSGFNICCNKQPTLKNCSDMSGIICTSGKTCSVSTVKASDTNECCKGSCNAEVTEIACENSGYQCKEECSDLEEENSAYSSSCSGTKMCCQPKGEGGFSMFWIVILIILIVLLVVAIIFRDRLKIMFFNLKNKLSKDKGSQTQQKPGYPPAMPPSMQRQPMQMPRRYPQPMPGRMPPRQPRRPVPKR